VFLPHSRTVPIEFLLDPFIGALNATVASEAQ
jgi:hypothetical protein